MSEESFVSWWNGLDVYYDPNVVWLRINKVILIKTKQR